MSAFNARSIIYVVNCTLAALLSLGVAFTFDLSNPYVAALSAFLAS